MLKLLVLVLVVGAAAFAVVRVGALESAGLLGGCTDVVAPQDDTGSWKACRPGTLAGAPDLSKKPCTRERSEGELVFWRCPAPLEANLTRQ